jgi:hypothetical protein
LVHVEDKMLKDARDVAIFDRCFPL